MKHLYKKLLLITALLCVNYVNLMAMNPDADAHLLDAVIHGDVVGVRNAIADGAYVNQITSTGDTPLFHAMVMTHHSTMGHERYLQIVEELINHEANVNLCSEVLGMTPLTYAAFHKDLPLFRILMKANNKNVDMYDTLYGCTPLLHIVRFPVSRYRIAPHATKIKAEWS